MIHLRLYPKNKIPNPVRIDFTPLRASLPAGQALDCLIEQVKEAKRRLKANRLSQGLNLKTPVTDEDLLIL
jgi:hypothetical protein